MDASIDIDWCRARLTEHLRQPTDVLEVNQVPSRLAAVYRLVVNAGATRRRYYLKRHTDTSLATSFPEYVAHMSTVATKLSDRADLLPFDVVAVDSRDGVVLVGETPGRSLFDLHHEWIRTRRGRDAIVAAWRGVGRWLAALHRAEQAPVQSATRAAEVVAYADERLVQWSKADRAHRTLAQRASEALRRALSQLASRPVTVALCHGDLSTANIMVDGAAVGLIDLDDVRLDMPALDLSQAVWEIREYCRVAGALPLRGLEALSVRALQDGYGESFPAGPEFWLPHMGNLAVVLLTVAGRRAGITPGRLTEELRYLRALAELRRTVEAIERD